MSTALQCLVIATAIVGMLAIGRYAFRLDHIAGWIFTVGVLLRLGLGQALFWVSVLQVPALAHLHTGDGFWDMLPDARTYYQTASDLVRTSDNLREGTASPSFVYLLTLWMRLAGVTVPAALLMNVIAYAIAFLFLAVHLLPHDLSARRAGRVALAALSLSPALVLFGSQVLKDQVFVTLEVLLCLSVFSWFRYRQRHSDPRLWLALGGACATLYFLAGMRAYFVCLAVALFVALDATLAARQRFGRIRAMGVTAVLTAALWVSFAAGGGVYYDIYEDAAVTLTGGTLQKVLPEEVWARLPSIRLHRRTRERSTTIDGAREGFVYSGGATNLVRSTNAAIAAPPSFGSRLTATSIGIAAIFVPIVLLKALGVVDFAGGRGLLFIADVDTVFIDITLVILAWILLKDRQWLRAPVGVYSFGLGVILLLLMAYVVTNFGTLFRLRLFAISMLWLIPIACHQAAIDPQADGALARERQPSPLTV